MTTASQWLVRIDGGRVHLDTLVRSFPNGDIFALQENGAYFLSGPAINNLNKSEAVLDMARAALNRFSGAVRLLQPEFRKPTISGVTKEHPGGRRDQYVFVQGIASIAEVGTPTVVTKGSPLATPSSPQAVLTAAERNASLLEALEVWSDFPISWPRLYRVLEAVERCLDQPINEAGFCSKSARERFARTANTAETAGIDCRHAAGKFEPPSDPMSLEEAVLFIRQVLKAALR